MKISYDPEADAIYIELREGYIEDSTDLEEGVTAMLDRAGHVIGLEVLDARERLGNKGVHVTIEGLETHVLPLPRLAPSEA